MLQATLWVHFAPRALLTPALTTAPQGTAFRGVSGPSFHLQVKKGSQNFAGIQLAGLGNRLLRKARELVNLFL